MDMKPTSTSPNHGWDRKGVPVRSMFRTHAARHNTICTKALLNAQCLHRSGCIFSMRRPNSVLVSRRWHRMQFPSCGVEQFDLLHRLKLLVAGDGFFKTTGQHNGREAIDGQPF